jgi:hypothetical protein
MHANAAGQDVTVQSAIETKASEEKNHDTGTAVVAPAV